MPTAPAQAESASDDPVVKLVARPHQQRIQEYKYRFSQSVVFGLPVLALSRWGSALGPTDYERWGSVLQALLTGWVIYVNSGMLFEGLMLLRSRIALDLLVVISAIAAYLWSLFAIISSFIRGQPLHRPLLFPVCIVILTVWTGIQWRRHALHTLTTTPSDPFSRETDPPKAPPSDR